jgi:hypothetical protein
MAFSAFKGPVISFGNTPQTDSNDMEGPDVNNVGSVLQDPRAYTTYAGGDWAAGWFQCGRGYVTIDAVPATINATCIAATQSAATAVVLASSNNSTSQVVVNAQFINVNTGALVTGALALNCPNATATGQFMAYGSGGVNGQRGVNVWDPSRAYGVLLSVTAAGTDTGRTVTIAGNDPYGVPLTQTVTVANTSAVATTKAFKYVRSVTLDALPTGGISIGIGTVFGLPLRADNVAYLQINNRNTAMTALTAAVTSAASATSGDVRGTILAATDGTSRLVVFQSISASNINLITTGTNSGLLGVDQV